LEKVQDKRRGFKEQLKTVRAEVQFLTAADTQLSAAIVAALLSTRDQE